MSDDYYKFLGERDNDSDSSDYLCVTFTDNGIDLWNTWDTYCNVAVYNKDLVALRDEINKRLSMLPTTLPNPSVYNDEYLAKLKSIESKKLKE